MGMVGGKISDYYLIGAIIPFYLWLLNLKKYFPAKGLIILLILISLFQLPKILTENKWSGNIADVKEICEKISTDFDDQKFNIAVLGSEDPNTKGVRYRDLLKIKGIEVEPPTNYDQPILYFISQKEWNDLVGDPSYEINNCRSKMAKLLIKTKNYGWKLYRCETK
jgi:hypothetical protein